MADFLAPADLAKAFNNVSEKKVKLPALKMLILGILAGVYIGFAAHLATTVATGSCEWLGLKKFMVGAVFSCGLMLVIIPGSELWTGNNLMVVGLLEKKFGFGPLLKNWFFVYLGNLIGSVLLALMIAKASGLLDGQIGGTAIKIAVGKVTAGPFGEMSHNYAYFFRAICCNWLVCLAVMMAVAAQDIGGKVLGIFFPIMAFVASGFEHCIANMYFIPAGIFAKAFPKAVAASGVSPEALNELTWSSMWTQNIAIVTLGNLVGGALFTGCVYWWLFVKKTD
jgi:formate/nitrite transporter